MLTQIWNQLSSFEFGTPDPFTAKLPFFGTPWQVFLINISYLLFVFKLGPAYMRNRPAYNLKRVILIYNVFQVLINFGMAASAVIMVIYYRAYDIRCLTPLADNHPQKYVEVVCFYLYYLVKFIDYLDTVFFVLRKSTRQITFLHVYHHLLMAISVHSYMRYYGIGGHVSSIGALNSTVHCFMYIYYFISALDPSMKNSIWWKKYITRLQLAQFVVITLHNLYPILFVPNCKSQMIICCISMLQGSVMMYLFGIFYKNTYMKKHKTVNEKIEKTN